MAVVGGDIKEISVNHSTLGNRVFKVKSNEGNTYDPGGQRTNDDANQITSQGEPVWQINMKMGGLNVTLMNDMNLKDDEFLVALASDILDGVYLFTVVNGKSYRGTGRIVGDIVPNINDSTLAVKIACPTLKQI